MASYLQHPTRRRGAVRVRQRRPERTRGRGAGGATQLKSEGRRGAGGQGKCKVEERAVPDSWKPRGGGSRGAGWRGTRSLGGRELETPAHGRTATAVMARYRSLSHASTRGHSAMVFSLGPPRASCTPFVWRAPPPRP